MFDKKMIGKIETVATAGVACAVSRDLRSVPGCDERDSTSSRGQEMKLGCFY